MKESAGNNLYGFHFRCFITIKDSVVFSGRFGYAGVAAKRKVNGETLFRMDSITKMVVSLAILTLIEEGK